MKFVADLHLHSKYSRAVSQNMTLPNMAQWAKIKGISVISTSDFCHPFWFDQLKNELDSLGNGLYRLKESLAGGPVGQVASGFMDTKKETVSFLLSCEIASIYSQRGKTRRIHTLFFFPTLESVEKFNKELLKRGANLRSDGRPIVGIPSEVLAEIALGCDQKALVIPAHCLPPDEFIHTKEGIKKIGEIHVGDLVYTHKNRARRVTDVYKRSFEGDLYHVRPWYFSMGTKVTGEHPFYAFKTSYCPSTGDKCLPTVAHKMVCKHRFYDRYKPRWIPAEMLEVGDILVFPRFKNTTPLQSISLNSFSQRVSGGQVFSGGTRGRVFPSEILMSKEFCRLVGYYLAEGCTNGRDEIRFAFSDKETEYANDVIVLIKEVFGISYYKIYKRKHNRGIEISFYSKLLVKFFQTHFYLQSPYRATTKVVPDWMLHLPEVFQAELLRGWWRGDQGYTSSRDLMDGMKIICLRLGIIPSILLNSKLDHALRGNHVYKGREIKATTDNYSLSHLAFFEDPFNLLKDSAFAKNTRKLTRRHGWIDEEYIFISIRTINKIPYKGDVFNLEVEEDNSYMAEFAAVHNCWTPWFSVFGSFSGFDSIEECFGKMADKIYGVETGLSSDPSMNWQVGNLDKRAILSFSDAHSLEKMGREATIFEAGEVSYEAIYQAITNKAELGSKMSPRISFTIEFYPEEGKYHFTGHRDCNFSQSPEESLKNGNICPVCHRQLTVGVMQRVEDLKTRELLFEAKDQDGLMWMHQKEGARPPYVSLVPLGEIIAEVYKVGVSTKKVSDIYLTLVNAFGSELGVLMRAKVEEIKKLAGDKVAEGIAKVRGRDIVIEPGYDNKFGVVKIWSESMDEVKEDEQAESQLNLFA